MRASKFGLPLVVKELLSYEGIEVKQQDARLASWVVVAEAE